MDIRTISDVVTDMQLQILTSRSVTFTLHVAPNHEWRSEDIVQAFQLQRPEAKLLAALPDFVDSNKFVVNPMNFDEPGVYRVTISAA